MAVDRGDTQVPIGVKRRLAALLEAKPPEGEQAIIPWPRTDKEGRLRSRTQLAFYKGVSELEREPGLRALRGARARPSSCRW